MEPRASSLFRCHVLHPNPRSGGTRLRLALLVDIVRRLWFLSNGRVRIEKAKSIDRARHGRSYEDDSTYRYRHVDHLGQLDQSDAVQCDY